MGGTCGYCVYYSLLCIFALINTLHADLYYEGENEETIRRRCRPDLSCFPSELEWAELKESMTGTLVWPDDSFNYTARNFQVNLRKMTFPIVHAVCKNVEDIQKAVRFAKEHNLRVTIKSTGLELWGRSSAHGSFSINLMEMKYMSVNPDATPRSEHGEVTVETGVMSRVLYEEVEKYNRIVLAGHCKKVSTGGFISGGGFGMFSAAQGLGVDNVLEIKVVLADGRVATCTPNQTVFEDNGSSEVVHDGKLFWALRGGGGGTFGVVVHYVLKLHPAPSSVISGLIILSLYNNESDRPLIMKSIEAYEEYVGSTPTYWGGSIFYTPKTIILYFAKLGPWDTNTESDIKPLIDFKDTYLERVNIVRLTNLSRSAEAAVFDDSHHVRNYYSGALIKSEKNNATGVWDFLFQAMMDHAASNVTAICSVSRLGGKIAEYDVTSSSLHAGFRRVQYAVTYTFQLPKDHELSSIKEQQRWKTHVAQFSEKLSKFQDGQYINIGYIPSPNWKADFWGEHNYADLLKVKKYYDPDNFFTCFHCVGSGKTDYDDEATSSSATATMVTENFTNIFLLLISVLTHKC